MKIVFYIIGSLLLLLGIGFVWRAVVKPDLGQIEIQTEDKYDGSEISYPENYHSVVAEERKNGRVFLLDEAVSGEIYENHFPYSHVDLSEEKTKAVLNILNDSSSYRWGEFGTPERELIIVYYNKSKSAIGYTCIDPLGEVENYPYRSIMKWGLLTDDAMNRMMEAL